MVGSAVYMGVQIKSLGYHRGRAVSQAEAAAFVAATAAGGERGGGDDVMTEAAGALYNYDLFTASFAMDPVYLTGFDRVCTLVTLEQPHYPSDWPARGWNARARVALDAVAAELSVEQDRQSLKQRRIPRQLL